MKVYYFILLLRLQQSFRRYWWIHYILLRKCINKYLSNIKAVFQRVARPFKVIYNRVNKQKKENIRYYTLP